MNKIFLNHFQMETTSYNLKKATMGSAGFDLVAAVSEKNFAKPNGKALIPCGFSLELPNNFEAQVRPRSGLALKNSITVLNSPGTIDSDYRGEVGVVLINHGDKAFEIKRGMRIAQIVFLTLPEIQIIESNTLSETDRGEGGFGSTGLNDQEVRIV